MEGHRREEGACIGGHAQIQRIQPSQWMVKARSGDGGVEPKAD